MKSFEIKSTAVHKKYVPCISGSPNFLNFSPYLPYRNFVIADCNQILMTIFTTNENRC